MENFRVVLLIIASFSILFGYLRFITDSHGNVDLNSYRFTGGLGHVIVGFLDGTKDIFTRHLTPDAVSTFAIYIGMILFYIGFKM